MKIFFLTVCLFISSCQSISNRSNYVLDTTSPDLVFPLNMYRQKISILVKDSENKKMTFDGAIKKGDGSLSLFAFTAVGFRVFTLNDHQGKVDIQVHVSQLEDKKDFILKMYPVIKKIFSLRTGDEEYLKSQFSYSLAFPIGDVDVRLIKSNDQKKVYKILVSKEKYFEFEIENVEKKLGQ